MFYSALCFVILRLGASRVECSSLRHSFLLLSPLRVQLPEWSVQPFVAVPWGESISVYSHIGVQFPADSDSCFYECVDMCGLLEVLFDTLLYALTNWRLTILLSWPLFVQLRVPMVRLCCLLSLGSYSWLKFYYRLH